MRKVLVAEDESSIREFIVINLKRAGYDVTEAENGRVALDKFLESGCNFDVAILDIMMPEMDGLTLCKELRNISKSLGIVMLTAKTQEMDKVTGLLVGADDYITKPFSPSELSARVDALYRRVAINKENGGVVQSNEITLGRFVLNTRNHTLTKDGKPISLTQVEFQLMEYFFRNPDAALDRTDILKKVWGDYADEKIVDVNMRRLRMKVEDVPSDPAHLITVWGLGYKWVSEVN